MVLKALMRILYKSEDDCICVGNSFPHIESQVAMVSFSYLPKHSGKSIFLELKSNKKAAPHGEAFTININLKNFIS